MAVSEAQKRATSKYSKKLRKYIFACNKVDDADVIERIDSEPNKTAYIKKLVRGDING